MAFARLRPLPVQTRELAVPAVENPGEHWQVAEPGEAVLPEGHDEHVEAPTAL